MIEKKISYNEPRPTKVSNIKPVKQGGRLNYLGKQKTITAPVKWKSGPTHPVTHLAYITDEEQKILVDLNIYKSMDGKPNKGPFGIVSLNDGDGSGGGGSGSDGAGAGDSGGSGGGASASGGGGDDGAGASSAGDAGGATGDSAGVGGSGDSAAGGVGSGPGGEADTSGVAAAQAAAQSISADDVATAAQADAEDAATAAAAQSTSTTAGVMNAIANMARTAMNNPMATIASIALGPVAGLAVNAISAANRGVTGPSDDTQENSSVQSGPAQDSSGGGITTLPTYAPLSNTSTGDNTADAMRIRLENLLKVPTTQTVFQNQNVNSLSNYTLADLARLRGL
jgi:hypothetical protein